ncbi:MAG: hypothetical protein JSS86_19540, partial [Cyanobacteria bacterium SZAS LIN-2]|nr:hypothetical protein [Cyanobacteria bacterium SZAS LIN-2]
IQGTKVTYRSDLYSMGCMLYMCLTGTPPFVGENKLRTMEKHCTTAPLPLRQASRGKEFPPGIEPIVMRLLEKDPADRYNSVDEFKEALIDMAVANGYMRRPPGQPGAIGQLYMTGVIPEMPKTIVDMVPNSGTTQAFDGLYEGAGKTSAGSPVAFRENERNNPAFRQGTVKFVDRKHLYFLLIPFFLGAVVAGAFFLSNWWKHHSTINRDGRKEAIDIKPQLSPSSGLSLRRRETDMSLDKALTADQEIDALVSDGFSDVILDLSRKRGLTDRGLGKLKFFKRLRTLDLSYTDISGSSLGLLARNRFIKLNLEGNRRIQDWNLNFLSNQSNLQELSLVSTGITDHGLHYVARLKSLTTLLLGQNPRLSDTGVVNLDLAESKIRVLFLNDCSLSDRSVWELRKMSDLVWLNLSGNPGITGKTLEILEKRAADFKRLYLADTRLTEADLHRIRNFTGLIVLDLSGLALSSATINDLATLKGLRNLYVVDCHLSEQQLDRLESLLPSTVVSRNIRPTYEAVF